MRVARSLFSAGMIWLAIAATGGADAAASRRRSDARARDTTAAAHGRAALAGRSRGVHAGRTGAGLFRGLRPARPVTKSRRIVDQLGKQLAGRRFLLLGESTHGDAQPYELLDAVLETHGQRVDFVTFEIGRDRQAALDDFLAGRTDNLPDTLAPSRLNGQSLPAFRKALLTIRALNRARENPIEVVAMDLADPPADSDQIAWFLDRDRAMFDLLRDRGLLSRRGIVFAGAAHLARAGYPVPGVIAQAAGTGATDRIASLGQRLVNAPGVGPGEVYSVWIQPPLDVDRAPIPSEFRPSYRVVDRLPRVRQALFETRSPALRRAARSAGVSATTPLGLIDNFDGLLKLGSTFNVREGRR